VAAGAMSYVVRFTGPPLVGRCRRSAHVATLEVADPRRFRAGPRPTSPRDSVTPCRS
jgi:hypothetical protein